MCKRCLSYEAKEHYESNSKLPFYMAMPTDEYIKLNYSNYACWIYSLGKKIGVHIE